MRTIRLLLEYDGTAFHGWQEQADQPRRPTVQRTLEEALEKLTQERIRVRAASRTDAGVHARGQVVAFDTSRDGLPLRAFERGLPTHLPPSIVIRRAADAPPGWHPRFESRGKRYRYTYWNDESFTAIDRARAWFVRAPMDLDLMRAGAALLVGTHDFEAFRASGCSARHAIRTLYRIEIEPGEYARIHLEVIGNAFVRNMVRIIAGNLRDVAIGKMTIENLQTVLQSRDRTLGAATAPGHGLCLEEVIFDDRLPPRPVPQVVAGEAAEEDEQA